MSAVTPFLCLAFGLLHSYLFDRPDEKDPVETALARTVAAKASGDANPSAAAVASAERFLSQDRFEFTIQTLSEAFKESGFKEPEGDKIPAAKGQIATPSKGKKKST
mmetsp:Transcript_38154/g.86882  ORF Transcript_38154/g.86882 Transcript_38154/m.86882 type:complete len:107 (-) Transcript_38154:73-393(-)